MCRTAWFYLYQIGKIRKYLTEDQTKSAIHAHVTSRLDQNNSLLLGLQKEKLTRLQRVQNAAARLIAGLRKKDHITPTLKRLHWLPIEQRIIYKVLVLVYKALSGEGPLYLQELLQRYVPLRKLRIEQDHLLCVPNCNFVNTERRAFGIRAPAEWNKLPRNLRCKDTLVSFKSGLKTFLFQVAYE